MIVVKYHLFARVDSKERDEAVCNKSVRDLQLTFFMIITRNGSLIARVFFGSAGH